MATFIRILRHKAPGVKRSIFRNKVPKIFQIRFVRRSNVKMLPRCYLIKAHRLYFITHFLKRVCRNGEAL